MGKLDSCSAHAFGNTNFWPPFLRKHTYKRYQRSTRIRICSARFSPSRIVIILGYQKSSPFFFFIPLTSPIYYPYGQKKTSLNRCLRPFIGSALPPPAACAIMAAEGGETDVSTWYCYNRREAQSFIKACHLISRKSGYCQSDSNRTRYKVFRDQRTDLRCCGDARHAINRCANNQGLQYTLQATP